MTEEERSRGRVAADALMDEISSRLDAERIGSMTLLAEEKRTLSALIGHDEETDSRLGLSLGPLLYADSDDTRSFLFGLAEGSARFAYGLGTGAAVFTRRFPDQESIPSFHVSGYESRRWLAALRVDEFAGKNTPFAEGFSQGMRTPL